MLSGIAYGKEWVVGSVHGEVELCRGLSLFSGEPWPLRVVWSLYPHISWTVEVGSFTEGRDFRRNYIFWLRLSPKREAALFHQQPRFLAIGGD